MPDPTYRFEWVESKEWGTVHNLFIIGADSVLYAGCVGAGQGYNCLLPSVVSETRRDATRVVTGSTDKCKKAVEQSVVKTLRRIADELEADR